MLTRHLVPPAAAVIIPLHPTNSTFTEEAERTCKGDFLCDKMSVSASGLLYHFDQVCVVAGF
jgi:hypothetical protein